MVRRHIAVLTTSYPARPGEPSGHFVESECRALVRAGHRVTVVCPLGQEGEPGQSDQPRVLRVGGGAAFGSPGVLERLRTHPLRVVSATLFCARARALLQRLAPDELVAHWLLPSLLITDAFDRPVTAVAHGSDVALLGRLPRPVVERLLSRWLAQGVRFRFVAERLRAELLEACDERLARRLLPQSYVEPCMVELPGVCTRAEARAQLGVGDGFLALCVSRLVPGKRVDWALTHAPVPPHTRWVVVGDGPERAQLERRFPEVEFTGELPRHDALRWMAAADVVVQSSLREGAPSVIREARSLGTPVWTNDVGDVRLWAANDPGITVLDRLAPGPRP